MVCRLQRWIQITSMTFESKVKAECTKNLSYRLQHELLSRFMAGVF